MGAFIFFAVWASVDNDSNALNDSYSGPSEIIEIQEYSSGTAFGGELLIEVDGIAADFVIARISSIGYPNKTTSILDGQVGGSFTYEGANLYEIHVLEIEKNRNSILQRALFEVRLIK